ncbi:hypothetical protein WS71_25960 [Burkholderia mayonis]|uniref:Uncharacterized protein n=1 Tax=Burkholderia mayonis TaxID=1385591 RepID=A0A1B4G3Y4_9BURK|nr:hypothetical protein WS71_25960 [Burkholderia mayonis]KVE53190.1 hypothetical protein WS71_07980 [Burkholderia mayonis]
MGGGLSTAQGGPIGRNRAGKACGIVCGIEVAALSIGFLLSSLTDRRGLPVRARRRRSPDDSENVRHAQADWRVRAFVLRLARFVACALATCALATCAFAMIDSSVADDL